MLSNATQTIPTFDTDLTYNEFHRNYMAPNLPCLIKGVAKNWNCTRLWVENGAPNLNYLSDEYGDCEVTIYRCNEKYFNSQKTYTSSFADYIRYWRNPDGRLDYLKDWHLKLQRPNDDFYKVPKYFASDWLNEYLVAKGGDDYRFVYMGPKGTWTPFHSDVFNSFSWSVNVCGRKRWLFMQPGRENDLLDNLNNLPYDVSACDPSGFIEVIQEAGDAVFVPSGWHHQVWNLTDAISVNHNWFNGCNIMWIWNALEANLALVKREIRDCEDMDDYVQHCQVMLDASFGINYCKFIDLLEFIGRRRMDNNVYEDFKQIDLKAIKSVLTLMCESSEVGLLSMQPTQLLNDVILETNYRVDK